MKNNKVYKGESAKYNMETKKLNLEESINFLNEKCDYINVEDDYTNKEIVEIANAKFEDYLNDTYEDDDDQNPLIEQDIEDIAKEFNIEDIQYSVYRHEISDGKHKIEFDDGLWLQVKASSTRRDFREDLREFFKGEYKNYIPVKEYFISEDEKQLIQSMLINAEDNIDMDNFQEYNSIIESLKEKFGVIKK